MPVLEGFSQGIHVVYLHFLAFYHDRRDAYFPAYFKRGLHSNECHLLSEGMVLLRRKYRVMMENVVFCVFPISVFYDE